MEGAEQIIGDGIEVLIVEDSVTQAEQLRYILETNGYQVRVANDGKKALVSINERKPTIIITDVVMPNMDGYELCRTIKGDDDLSDIPVIIVSYLSNVKDVIKGLESGADNFIIKPYDATYLLSRIEYILDNYKRSSDEMTESVLEITYNGMQYCIKSTRQQILDFLLSTYETAMQKNMDLVKTQEELEKFNDDLEKIVDERTVSLKNEIIARKRVEEEINASLKEKEILLQEIHHRVKNNMQIISSLLRLQSDSIEDEQYHEMFKDSQNRIITMSLVHEKLYQSSNFSEINFGEYIRDITNNLAQSYCRHGITLTIDTEDILLGINFAVPCGLIINELVTNSLKHAFPAGKEGEIKVSLHPKDDNMIELIVSDNGVGIPADFDIDSADQKSLGLRLVKILTENQLRGEIDLIRNAGTKFHIMFNGDQK